MSENIWGDEDNFNDTIQYDPEEKGWKEPEPGAIPRTPRPQPAPQQSRFQLPPAEEAQIVNDVLQDLGDDDEEDTVVLSDATLRLEQGRLYQMVMNHNLFQGMDADPRAIKNVQREIRKFARERMEIMLGMRQESTPQPQQQVVSSPFNDIEVQALKMLAAKVTGGRSEQAAEKPAPAKKELTPISSPAKPAQAPAPIVAKPSPKPQQSAVKLPAKPAAPIKRAQAPTENDPEIAVINKVMDGKLTKPLHKMTADELAEHNKKVSERQAARKAKAVGALPMPTADQEEMLYLQRAAQASISVGGKAAPAVSAIVAAINNKK